MKNKAICGLALLLLSWGVKAAPVSMEAAKQTATAFYGVQCLSAEAKSMPAFVCVYPRESKGEEFVPYYIFNAGDDKGFVIVAGDDNATRLVLAYSDKGHFDSENMPENLRGWLEFYEEGVRAASRSSVSVPHSKGFTKAEVVKEPILGEISYNQDAPYNELCPIDPATNKRTYTGCVATALASIARYYQYPEKGRGSISYTTTTRKIELSMDFSQNEYDWENMLEAYNGGVSSYTQEQRTAIATLMRDMGYAVRMDYTSNASGAIRENSVVGMVDYMGFDSILSHRDRSVYDNEAQWLDMIKSNIDLNQPVYYTGQSTGGGHAFIADGYDEADYFHIDWGWGKSQNGYFSLNVLDPENRGIGGGTGGGYASLQAVMCNLIPEGHAHPSDDYFISVTSSIDLKGKVESTAYATSDSISIDLSGFYNHTMSRFEGIVALAAFKDGEFVEILSNEDALQLRRFTSDSKAVTLKGTLQGLSDGEYEIWAVQKSNRENAVWNKIYTRQKSLVSDSYVPVSIEDGTYTVLPVGASLSIVLKCNAVQNVEMAIKQKDVLVFSTKISTVMGGRLNLRYGTYDLSFVTSGYDTAFVKGFELTKDTTLTVEMKETIAPPYLFGRYIEYNTVDLMWKPYNPRETPVYPKGFALYLDSVEVATVGANVDHYLYTGLSLGEHQIGVQSIFTSGKSEIQSYLINITTLVANENRWQQNCRITPNPSSTGNFKVEAGEKCRVQVCSMAGNVLFERHTDATGVVDVDMTAYTAGLYLFRLVAEDGRTTVLKAVLR